MVESINSDYQLYQRECDELVPAGKLMLRDSYKIATDLSAVSQWGSSKV